MNQCRRAGEEAVLPPPHQPFGEDRKHIANGYLCSGGLFTPLRPLSRAILPLLLSFPVANPSSHLKGIHTRVQIISAKIAAQFISSLLLVEEGTAGPSLSKHVGEQGMAAHEHNRSLVLFWTPSCNTARNVHTYRHTPTLTAFPW